MQLSSFLRLNKHDFFRGMLMAVGSALYAIAEPLLSVGVFKFEWRNLASVALGSAVVYLLKNLLTPAPKTLEVDTTITTVIDKDTKEVIAG